MPMYSEVTQTAWASPSQPEAVPGQQAAPYGRWRGHPTLHMTVQVESFMGQNAASAGFLLAHKFLNSQMHSACCFTFSQESMPHRA